MEQNEITLQSLADNDLINIDYIDDDLIIIDNITSLAEPSQARIKMNFIALCMRGRVQADMNGQTITIAANQLLLCPPNVSFSNFLFSHDFEFKALFLTPRILQSFLREKMNVWNEVMYIHKMHVLPMEGQDIQFLNHFYEMLRLCIDTRVGNPYRSDIIQALIRGALLGLCGMLKMMLSVGNTHHPSSTTHHPSSTTHHPTLTTHHPSSITLFQRFLNLLDSSPQKHHTVAYYASELCISPKYLSTICKANSGKTANEWITEHVMEDIRYYLLSTDLSVKQVSAQLGFANPSFFGQYVKEHFGKTPLELKQQKR